MPNVRLVASLAGVAVSAWLIVVTSATVGLQTPWSPGTPPEPALAASFAPPAVRTSLPAIASAASAQPDTPDRALVMQASAQFVAPRPVTVAATPQSASLTASPAAVQPLEAAPAPRVALAPPSESQAAPPQAQPREESHRDGRRESHESEDDD